MAPRKEKTEKALSDNGHQALSQSGQPSLMIVALVGSTMILEYLKKQNRPYSANDVSANLHNKVTKTYAAKALKEMHENNTVAAKSAGKQTVYHVLQNLNDAAGPEEIVAMDQEINDLREQIASTKANDKTLRSNLASVNATISTQDLRESVKAFEREKQHLLGRLGPLRSGSVKPISVAEKAVVDKAWKEWSENARARKKICLEVWACVTEMLPDGKTEVELWEELGLESDE